MNIRLAKPEDLREIVEIYNQFIPSQKSTAETTLASVESKKEWFNNLLPNKYPLFVYMENNTLIGYCYLSAYRNGRQALYGVREISYYIHKDHHRKGIAGTLVEHAIQWSSRNNVKNLITFIMAHNEPSTQLMKKFNFELWGKLPNVISFGDKTYDHLIFGRKITPQI